MADLRDALSKGGFEDVRTYIQTGNVLFRAEETDRGVLARKLEARLAKTIKYFGKVFVLTPGELKRAAAGNPFKEYTREQGYYVTIMFLSAAPQAAELKALEAVAREDYGFALKGNVLYIRYLVPKSNQRRSVPIERLLGVTGTFRTSRVVDALIALSSKP